MPSSEELKTRSSMDTASRPYEDADSAWRSLRGKIGLGRSQDNLPRDVAAGAGEQGGPSQPAPPAVDPSAPVTPTTEPPTPPPPNNETPVWPADISSRFAAHVTDAASVYSPEALRGMERGGLTDMPMGQRDVAARRPQAGGPSAGEQPLGHEPGSSFIKKQYGGDQPSTIQGQGFEALAHTGLTGALRAYFAPENPQEQRNAEEIASALFMGTIGAGELDIALTAAAKFIEPRLPGAVSAIKAYADAEGGMARVDMGLTPPAPFERLASLTDEQITTIRQLAGDPKDIAEFDAEIARRGTASRLADTLASAGKTTDAMAVRSAHEVPVAPSELAPHDMTVEQLDLEIASASNKDKTMLQELFGVNGGKRYETLQRQANSTTNIDRADKASEEIQKMESGLSKQQQDRLFGIGETGPQLDELKDIRSAVGRVGGDTPQELGDSIKWALSKIGGEIDPAKMGPEARTAYAQIQEALRQARSSGWSTQEVSRSAISSALERFTDPGDKAFMARQFQELFKPRPRAVSGGPLGKRIASQAASSDPGVATNEALATARGEAFKPATGGALSPDSFDTIVGDAGKVTSKAAPQEPFKGKPAAMQLPAKGPTEAPISPKIRYPTEENLGIPAGYKNLPQNIQDSVTENARSIYDEIQKARGGVVNLGQVHQESKQIMIDAGILAQTPARTPVTAPGAEALIAAHVQVTAERDALMAQAHDVWPNVPDELASRIAVKVFDQNSIQKVIAGARAEWGRVGQQWQRALASGDPVLMRDTYKSVQKAFGGKANLDDVIARLHAIENDPMLFGDPYRKQKIARQQVAFIDQIHHATTAEKLREAFRNGILSIPRTHEAYVMGMSVYREVEALAKLPAAAIDKVLAPIEARGLLGSRARGVRESGGRLSFNQAVAEVAATQSSIPRAFMAFGRAMIHGDNRTNIFEETGRYAAPRALEGSSGAFLNLPTRVINAYTAGLHESGRYPSMWRQAVAITEKEMPGRSVLNRDFMRRASEIVTNPEAALAPKAPGMTAEATAAAQQSAILKAADMRAVAEEEGRRISLRGQQRGGLAEKIRGVRDWEPRIAGQSLGGIRPLYRVMPFINIGFNIAEQGFEYTPFGFARVATTAGVARSEAIARAGMGTLLWKFFADKADAGEMTGASPTDSNERAEWQREGKTPYSLKWGGEWHDISRFEPLATGIKWMAGFNDSVKEMQASPDPNSLAAHGVLAAKMAFVIGQGFTDMSWNIGLHQIGQMAHQFDIAAKSKSDDISKWWAPVENFIGSQAASQIPGSGFLRHMSQATDPYVRSPRGIEQQIEAMIPGLSALVPKSAPSRYGEDVRRPDSQQGLSGMFNPLRGSPSSVDPADEFLSHYHLPTPDGGTVKTLFMTLAASEIAKHKLNAEEGRMMQTYVGRAAHQAITRLASNQDTTMFNGVAFSKLPEPAKVKAIQKTIADARRTGRAVTADVIVQAAVDAPAVARGMAMRMTLIGDRAEKAMYIEGIARQGKFSPQASALLTTALREGQGGRRDSPTAAQYLAAAPGVRDYLDIPAFVGGDPSQLKELERERSHYNEERRIDTLDGTSNAATYFSQAKVLGQYARIGRGGALAWTVRENPARARYRAQHKSLAPFLEGLTYTQEAP